MPAICFRVIHDALFLRTLSILIDLVMSFNWHALMRIQISIAHISHMETVMDLIIK